MKILAVVCAAGETAGTVTVSVTVAPTSATRPLAGAAGPRPTPPATVRRAAVGGGGDAWEHVVTVVSPAHQVVHTVAVRVAVPAPQPAGVAWGAAGALASLPVTVLTRHVNIAITYHTLTKGI